MVITVIIINAPTFVCYCEIGSFRVMECLVSDISIKRAENFLYCKIVIA